MKDVIQWFKTTFPGVYKFFSDFFNGMNNKKEGHSLKKWLTVGFFWLIVHLCEKNTTPENLEYIITALLTALLTLAGVYTYNNLKNKKMDLEHAKPTSNESTQPETQDQGG